MPVDHPLIRPETVRALAAVGVGAVIPSFNGKHGHPICIDREVVTSIVCGDFNGPTMREILKAVGAGDLEVDDPGVVANCNTPAALIAALNVSSQF